jgi:hypothetical protein
VIRFVQDEERIGMSKGSFIEALLPAGFGRI